MIGAGDFSFFIKTGYLIEDGKLTQPIKDTNIIGNGPSILADTDLVGSDFKMDASHWPVVRMDRAFQFLWACQLYGLSQSTLEV